MHATRFPADRPETPGEPGQPLQPPLRKGCAATCHGFLSRGEATWLHPSRGRSDAGGRHIWEAGTSRQESLPAAGRRRPSAAIAPTPSSRPSRLARRQAGTTVASHHTRRHHGSETCPGPRCPPLRPRWPQHGDEAGRTPLRFPSTLPTGESAASAIPRPHEDGAFCLSSGTDEDASLLG